MESFTPEEQQALAPYFTNVDRPVFVLINLPEVVKGALFARYSRSAKSLRRLFLDEFLDQVRSDAASATVGTARAEELYRKVFVEYGDDSVAQLGGVHLACGAVLSLRDAVLSVCHRRDTALRIVRERRYELSNAARRSQCSRLGKAIAGPVVGEGRGVQ